MDSEKQLTDGEPRRNLRNEMVVAATKFLKSPRVSETPFSEQKKFLLKKGVTEEEIEEARQRAAFEGRDFSHSWNNLQIDQQQPARGTGSNLMSFANSVLIFGGLAYTGYRFLRSVVLPKFFDVPDPSTEDQRQFLIQMNEMQNSMKFVMDSVTQTLQMVNRQQELLERVVSTMSMGQEPYASRGNDELKRLQNDITTIKSLLLNRDQFPPVPGTKSVLFSNTVPTWQLKDDDNETHDVTPNI
ncbi:hypothetical protein AB6A40_003512 [Gnathostoma spinigerum]|uniref:Peroxisomal membrane protein PEX14 n=1 Tax=Gnathostoma spinigerum TaxID=75299 RepID=A0ABD6E9Y1_9BILA